MGGQTLTVDITVRSGYGQVEGFGQLGCLGAAHHDGEQGLGLDTGIVEAVGCGQGGCLGTEVLQIGHFLVALASGQQEGSECQQPECLIERVQFVN